MTDDRLIDLAHLSSAVGHYLINAFSATVSNAELIRSPIEHPADPKELGGAGDLDHRDGALMRRRSRAS